MASLAKTFDFIYHRLTQPYNPEIAALKAKENEMAAALIRVHKTHLFQFLDLPKKIRTRIYSFIFAANIVTVCSYNKDRTSQFHSSDERCQILLTCRAIYKEAYRMYYWHSDWKFTKVSSLNYMAWGDGGAKLQFIQNVTITNRDVVATFEDYLHLFQNLKNLIVDFPTKLKLQKPLKQQDHARIVRRVKNGEWYKKMVGVYLPTAGKRNFNIKVGVQISHGDGSGNDQMILIDIDRFKIEHNYRPVDPPLIYGALHMPSSDDPDAELTEIYLMAFADTLLQPTGDGRRRRPL